jgi:hypothetical protein
LLFRRRGLRTGLDLRFVMLLATGGNIGIKPQVLKGLGRRFTIIAIVQGRRDRLWFTQLVCGPLNT